MKKRIVSIQSFANHFVLIWMSGDRDAMQREVHEISCNRPGLELTGFFDYPRPTRIVLIGNKETAYIKEMSRTQIKESFDFIFSDKCPGCVICGDNDVDPYVLEIAREKNFPLFKSNRRTNDLSTDIVTYLSEELAPATSLHGTLVDIYSTGVLIVGESIMASNSSSFFINYK